MKEYPLNQFDLIKTELKRFQFDNVCVFRSVCRVTHGEELKGSISK